MNVQNNNVTEYENEITLQELFVALWKQKLIIISTTLIAAIIAGIISVFLITPVYDSDLNIVINMPETFDTKYGTYTLAITTNNQYIELIKSNDVIKNTIKDMGYNDVTLESLKDRISIGNVAAGSVEQNSFNITVSADNPSEAQKLAAALYDNYIKYLDVITTESAVEYYTNLCTVNIHTLEATLQTNKELLKKTKELLAETPQTINQKDAMQQIKNTTGYVVLENIINPNYTVLESDVINYKKAIIEAEENISTNNTYLEELSAVKNNISEYYKTGEFSLLQSDIINMINSNIRLASQPVAPNRKTSPSNAKNVVIGAILGAFIGGMVAFIKEFWFKKNVNDSKDDVVQSRCQ